VIPVLLSGVGFGLGLWLVIRSRTARPSLADVAASMAEPGRPAGTAEAASRAQVKQRVAARVIEVLRVVGVDPRRREADLRICGRTSEREPISIDELVQGHVLAQLTATLVGLGFGVSFARTLGTAGVDLGVGLVAVLAFGGAAAGFLYPGLKLTERARDRRRTFKHAFSAYLDLVNVLMATGAGAETALRRAAGQGGGWAFAEIRAVLEAARRTRRPLDEAFKNLARELDVPELAKLGSAVTLVGTEGARIRDTLAAQADTLRAHQIAQVEADAESATERMTGPQVLMVIAFLLFVLFPAVTQVSSIGTAP
jgi:tight adherence protein C